MFSLMVTFVILSTCIVARGVGASFNEDTFTVVGSLANKVCPVERRLGEFEAVSRLSCMTKAARRSDCAGVGYHDNNRVCYICDTYQETLGLFPSLPGTTFYQRSSAVTTTTTTTTTTTITIATTNAPASTSSTTTTAPGGYTNIAGYIVNVVITSTLNYTDAKSACAAASETLVRLDTKLKQDAISAFLDDPSNGLKSYNFWVQAQLDSGDGVWKFDDGSPVTMTTDFWFPGQPSHSEACGQLYTSFRYKWDDRGCHYTNNYICE